MAEKAKILNHDGAQDVRLPESCRFPEGQDEVTVRREGTRVILEPPNAWPQEFLDLIGSLDEDLPRYPQQPVTQLKDPFE